MAGEKIPTWKQCKNTSMYIGVTTEVGTNGALSATIYIKANEIHWTNSNSYTFKVTGNDITRYVKGIVLQNNTDETVTHCINPIQPVLLGYLPLEVEKNVEVTLYTGNTYEGVSVDGETVSESVIYAPDISKCGAPTVISVSPSIISPTGSFTISWSGAKNGINNLINRYKIYYNISEGGLDPNFDSPYQIVDLEDSQIGQTNGSTQISFEQDSLETKRGWKIVCKIQAINTLVNEYYWSGLSSKSSRAITVNIKPLAPLVSIGNVTLPSTADSGQLVTATAGAVGDMGQVGSVYYSKANEQYSTKYLYSHGITINPNPGQSETYRFYTFDGIEYSEIEGGEVGQEGYVECTVTKNAKPVITQIVTAQVPNQITAQGSRGPSGSYFLGWVNSIALKISTTKTGSIRWFVEMQATENNDTEFEVKQVYNLNSVNLSSISGVNLGSVNTDAAVENKYNIADSRNKYYRWRIGCVLNDGIEDSDTFYFPSGGQYYAVPGASDVLANYNRFQEDLSELSNIPGTIAGNMFDKVRFKLWQDSSITNTNVTARIGNTTVDCSNSVIVDNNVKYIDVTLSSPYSVPGGSQIIFSISSSNANITKIVNASMMTCLSPFISNTSTDGVIIKPFTGTSTYTTSIRTPFGGRTIEDGLRDYECGEGNYSAIKLVQEKGEYSREILGVDGNPQISNDSLSFTINRSNAFKFNGTLSERLGIDEYAGIIAYSSKIVIENLYGARYESNPASCYFNFNEEIQSGSNIASIEVSKDNTNWSTFTSGTGSGANKVQEGMYLRFKVNFRIYTEDNITIRINKDGATIKVLDLPSGSSSVNYATGRQAANNNIYVNIGKIGVVESSNDIKWTAEIYNDSGLVTTPEITTYSCEHTAPSGFTLNSCSLNAQYSTNYKLDYEYRIDNTGCDAIGSLTYVLSDGANAVTQNITAGTSSSVISGSAQCLNDYRDWDSLGICVRLTSVCSQTINNVTYSNTKVFYSNYIVVYSATPTLSYRKNRIGINTKNPSTDSVIDLYQSTGKDHIKFHAKNANQDVTWDMLLSTGIINYTIGSNTYTLDLTNVAPEYEVVSKTANGLCPKLPDETTTTKYLRQDGTWVVPPNTTYSAGNGITISNNQISLGSHTHNDADIEWSAQGYKNSSGEGRILDAALNKRLGANRFAGITSGVTIEYSTDGGSSWSTYPNPNIAGLFTIGGNLRIVPTGTTCNSNSRLRIIIDTSIARVYTAIRKFMLYITTSYSQSCTVTIDAATHESPTNFNKVICNNQSISGWSGWNFINAGSLITYGNADYQYQMLRFTFAVGNMSGGTATTNGLIINMIEAYGGIGWNTPSNLALTGHVYSYDSGLNVTFPAEVIATNFKGNATNVTGTVGIDHGGTGKTTAAEAWTALGGGASGKHADNYYVYHFGNAGKSNMNDVGRLHSSNGMTNLTSTSNADTPKNGDTYTSSWHLYWDASYSDNPNGSNAWVAQIVNKAGTDNWWVRSRNGGTITNGTAWTSSWRHLVTSTEAAVGSVTQPVYINANGEAVAATALGASAYHADSYFALSGHTHSYLPLSGGTLTNNLTLSGGSVTVSNGNIHAGTDGSTAGERSVRVHSGAGTIYMYSAASTSGNRGVYAAAHGTGGRKTVFVVDTNNNITFYGTLSGNATNVTGTVAIAHGGTGKTTAAEAWTALGGGAIGKKASLAASDIPDISTDKLTSGTLAVGRGGTGTTDWTSTGATKFLPRFISITPSTPTSLSTGQVALVYS